uniref:G-protein coupled receptors family 1 profile domain-containing protein n=1 Tax=Lates calcarifer TaxID=8187 RepID=A0A4W6DYW2_LATCA
SLTFCCRPSLCSLRLSTCWSSSPSPTSEQLPLLVTMLLVFVIFTVMIFSHSRQLHTPTNLLLLSLAVSDFLVGLLVMPFQILLTEPCWLLGDLVCSLCYILPFITVCASVVNMVLISVDRYVAICDPLHYSTRVTPRRIQVCVLLCWVYSIFYSFLLLHDNLIQPGMYRSCYGECVIHIIGTVDLVLNFIIPISAIIILYVRVFVVAVSQARAMRSHTAAVTLKLSGTATAKKSEVKAARTLGVIVSVFLMCYCPYYGVSLSGHNLTIGSATEVFMIFLVYFNSCLNPVIYAFLYPWFRKSVKLIVTLKILQPHSCEVSVL